MIRPCWTAARKANLHPGPPSTEATAMFDPFFPLPNKPGGMLLALLGIDPHLHFDRIQNLHKR